MLEPYAHWLIHWRYFVLLATLALAGLATLGFPLKFDTDYRVFFDEDNPELLAFDELQNTYTAGDDNVLLVLAPQDGQVFTRKTLSALEWLTKEAWQTPYSIRVDSITNFQAQLRQRRRDHCRGFDRRCPGILRGRSGARPADRHCRTPTAQ